MRAPQVTHAITWTENIMFDTDRAAYTATRLGRQCRVVLAYTRNRDVIDVEFTCDPLQFLKEAKGIVCAWEASTTVLRRAYGGDPAEVAKALNLDTDQIITAFHTTNEGFKTYVCLSIVPKQGMVQ